MKYLFTAILLILLSSTCCFGVDININKILFDKKLIDSIDWNNTSKYFKGKPVNTEYFKDSPIHHDYYGYIKLNGVDLKLTHVIDTAKNNSHISLYLPEYKEGDLVNNKKIDVDNIFETIKSLYGNNYIQYISKMYVKDKCYFVFVKYQWPTDKAIIVYDVSYVFDHGVERYFSVDVSYNSIKNYKIYKPVKFLECSYDVHFPNGDHSKGKDFTLGIDYNTNAILNDDYFESIFKIDGDFITAIREKDENVTTFKINRTSGKLSGFYKGKDNYTATYSGSCTILSDNKLF